MDRRHALAALAVVTIAPSTALAQKAQNTGVGMRDADAMGPAEKKHGEDTLAAGMVALETSKVAKQKGQNAWVKKFADYEVAEQETIAEILKSNGATPDKLTDKQNAMIKKMQEAKADASFDREYIAGQIEGHRDLLKIQEEYLSSGKNKHHLDVTKLARGQIKEHIDLLQTIQKDLKA